MEKAKENLIGIFKEKYDYEKERKRYYDSVINLPVSLLAFIVAGMYFILKEDNELQWFNTLKPYFVIPLLVTTVISMCLLFKVFFGYKRRYLSFPDSKLVLEDFKKLEDYYAANPNPDVPYDMENDFADFTITWYQQINENNIVVNDIRAKSFQASKMFIGINYLLAILVFTAYATTKFGSKPAPIKTGVDKTATDTTKKAYQNK